MKENVYKHLIITKTDVQDSVSVLRKTWKTIRCKVTREKKRPGTHGIQIYRLRSRSHVRWRDFKPAVDAACVCSLCGRAVITKVLHQCMQKNIYILFINTLNLSTAYICIISISYLSRIVQDGFLCQFWHFLVRESRWIWIALHSHFCWYKAGSSLKNARCIMINLCSWRIDAKKNKKRKWTFLTHWIQSKWNWNVR